MTTGKKGDDSYQLFLAALDVTNSSIEKFQYKPVINDIIKLADKHAAVSGRPSPQRC